MAAPKGNKNAEIWTIEEALKYSEIVLDYVISNDDCVSIQEAACNTGQYNEILIYLGNKFEIDFHAIKKANSIIEQRIYKKALQNKYNSTIAIFGLKNNHGWKDKHEIEQKTEITSIPPLKWFENESESN
jgi:hypothetical protein